MQPPPPDACREMTQSFDVLPAGCRVRVGVSQQTAALPAAGSHCVPHRALWWGKPRPPASLLHHPPPAPPRQTLGQAEDQRQGQMSYLAIVWWCWSRTTLTGWGLKQVVSTVSVGNIGSGVGRRGQHHAAGRLHHQGKPGGPLIVLVPGRKRHQEIICYRKTKSER